MIVCVENIVINKELGSIDKKEYFRHINLPKKMRSAIEDRNYSLIIFENNSVTIENNKALHKIQMYAFITYYDRHLLKDVKVVFLTKYHDNTVFYDFDLIKSINRFMNCKQHDYDPEKLRIKDNPYGIGVCKHCHTLATQYRSYFN